MRKKVLLLVAVMAAFLSPCHVWAYDFSYTYQGKDLYYTIRNGYAYVTYQSATTSQNYPNLSGTLSIPSTVVNGGTTYTVKGISDYAFNGCSGITEVTLPNTVTRIGEQAFGLCTGLTSFTIPSNVDTIQPGAFRGASNITTIYFNADSCKYMYYGLYGISAFFGCSGLTHIIIGDNVVKLPNAAFYNLASLTTVTIGSSLQEIGYNAFRDCASLTSIVIPSNITTIHGNAFHGCSGLTSVTLPNSIINIGSMAFYDCISLTSVEIPTSVTAIGDAAFSGCSGLTTITINNGSIGGSAFGNCTALTSVTIGSDVTQIGYSAFSGCSSLQSVIIGGGTIGSYAFNGCTSLTSVDINSGVTSIGEYAFNNCELLTSVTIPSSVTVIGNMALYADTVVMLGTTPPAASYVITAADVPYIMVPCGAGTLYRNTWSWTSWYTDNIIIDPCETTSTLTLINNGGGFFAYLDSYGEQQNVADTTRLDFLGSAQYTIVFASFVNNDQYSFTPQVTRLTVNGTDIDLSSIPSYDYGNYVMYQYTTTINSNTVIEVWFGDIGAPEEYNVIIMSSDENLGIVEAYYDQSEATAYGWAYAYGGTVFNGWSNGSMENPLTLTVTSDTTLIALFSPASASVTDTLWLTQYDTITNTVFDTIDNYIYDTTIVTDTLWLTQYDTIWLYDTVVVHDTIYITQEGIEGAETANAKIYQRDGHVVVEGVELQTVTFYDAVGRVMAVKRNEGDTIRFNVPASGTYLVKVGSAPARRIVVVK